MSNRHFPEIGNKLSAPAKKSQFERQKADAEAKRLREEAENAAALAKFEEEFGGGSESEEDVLASKTEASSNNMPYIRPGAFAGGGPPKRHFTYSMTKSGPGSLGPAPPSLSRKRGRDGSPVGREQGVLGYNRSSRTDVKEEFADEANSDSDAEMKDVEPDNTPIQKLYLANLPPTISQAMIKELIPAGLGPGQIQFVATDSNTGERVSKAARVTLAKATPLSDIDAAVVALDKRYLGYGHYLSIERQSSSSMPVIPGLRDANPSTNPFGARPVQNVNRGAAPGMQRGGYAPPGSYAASTAGRSNLPLLEVKVTPPSDLQQVKLIHQTVENLVEHGPEFEALLMSRPEVQKEEKWAWIWDPRSVGGVWYRWRLWEMLTQDSRSVTERTMLRASKQPIFDDGPAWGAPEDVPKFEFQTEIAEFVDDSDYVSSDMDDSGDEGPRRQFNTGAPPPEGGLGDLTTERSYLNPLEKAQLTWLLARLPITIAKLRKGDVARVLNFAVTHANRGMEEVVDMIIMNVEKPFSLTSANHELASRESLTDKSDDKTEKDDPSGAKLVALYIISDISQASPTAGVSGSWRYRSVLEAALRSRNVFQHLGRLHLDLGWGKIKADRWKRSVEGVLSYWQSSNCVSQESYRVFRDSFNNPPLTAAEQEVAKKEAEEKAKAAAAGKVEIRGQMEEEEEGEKSGEGSLSGERMDEDVDVKPVEGQMEAMETNSDVPIATDAGVGSGASAAAKEQEVKKEPKKESEDMFADSD